MRHFMISATSRSPFGNTPFGDVKQDLQETVTITKPGIYHNLSDQPVKVIYKENSYTVGSGEQFEMKED
jgi:hypothetical protein